LERRRLDEIVDSWLATVAPADATLSQRFEYGPEIGRGGVGLVRLAYETAVGRVVALKTLIAGTNAQESDLARFLAEARVTGQLDHPNIVPVYDLGRLPDGSPYYTMKLVLGRTLRDVLAGLRDGDEPTRRDFGRVRLLNVFGQVCAGVGYAHSKGVVHRDLKPGNVMLGAHGEVLVMDWGIAKVKGEQIRRWDLGSAPTASGQVMGTPTYMAPEQALGKIDEIDARTDVYSLGAMLYEILTMEVPFTGDTPLEVLLKVNSWSLIPPRERAPGLEIPEELEQICVRAMAKRPTDRYESAHDLRRDVEGFLEGARARLQADEHFVRGAAEVERMERARSETVRLRAQADEAGRDVRPFDPIERKRPAWEVEQRSRHAQGEAAAAFAQAAGAFEQALAFVPGHRGARRALAELYYARFQEAEARRDLEATVFFQTQVQAYDDGAYAALLRGDGTLALQGDPPGAEVLAARYADELGVLRLGDAASLGRTPLQGVALPMGSYLLTLRAEGRIDTRHALRVGRGQAVTARVRLPAPGEIEDGMAFVPGGPFAYGGDSDAPGSPPAAIVEVADFAIARFPVTQGEYREFINDLSGRDPEKARRRVPRTETEHRPHWVEERGLWQIPPVDGDGDPWDERMPVIGVSYQDAEVYCRWLAGRTGRPYRLPTEHEWEKAGRGADGRAFPWGDRFDATFCKMRDSRPGRVRLEAVGAYPMDESPFGVRDLAGGVREWVSSDDLSDPGVRVVRGGGAGASALTCRLCYRSWHQAADVTSYFGFRIARSV